MSPKLPTGYPTDTTVVDDEMACRDGFSPAADVHEAAYRRGFQHGVDALAGALSQVAPANRFNLNPMNTHGDPDPAGNPAG